MAGHAMTCRFCISLVAGLLILTPGLGTDKVGPTISDARKDASGVLVHTVECDYQDRPTTIQVLLPARLDKGKRYPVLYVLPVEAGDGKRFGNGLAEVHKHGLPDK